MILQHKKRISVARLVQDALGDGQNGTTIPSGIIAVLAFAFILLTTTHLWGHLLPTSAVNAANTVSLLVLCVLIILRPVWGIIIIGAVFPVAGILPQVGFTTSAFPLFGAATVVGYLREIVIRRTFTPRVTVAHAVALLLVIWIVASNPIAALSTGSRVWAWTYVQLLVLMFLTTQLLDSPSTQRALILTFVFGAVVSAFVAMHQVQYGLTSATSIRARGLAEGANDAGRYYVLAIVFLVYLYTGWRTRIARWASLAAIAILFVGLGATVSRTSVLLLVFAIVMMLLEQTTFLKDRLFQVGVALAAAGLLLIPDEYWRIVGGILSSILQGQDSAGFRYMQWDAGLAMWADHPVKGVGIGQFKSSSVYYGTNFIPFYGIRWTAHNTYVTMLAETGAVGFVLFMALVTAAGVGLAKSWLSSRHGAHNSLHYTWLTVFAVMLMGAITGDDHTHKFLWLLFGIGAAGLTPLIRRRN